VHVLLFILLCMYYYLFCCACIIIYSVVHVLLFSACFINFILRYFIIVNAFNSDVILFRNKMIPN